MSSQDKIQEVKKRLTRFRQTSFALAAISPLLLVFSGVALIVSGFALAYLVLPVLSVIVGALLVFWERFGSLLQPVSAQTAANLIDQKLGAKDRFLTLATTGEAQELSNEIKLVQAQADELSGRFDVRQSLNYSCAREIKISLWFSPLLAILLLVVLYFWRNQVIPFEDWTTASQYAEELKAILEESPALPEELKEDLLNLAEVLEEDGLVSESVEDALADSMQEITEYRKELASQQEEQEKQTQNNSPPEQRMEQQGEKKEPKPEQIEQTPENQEQQSSKQEKQDTEKDPAGSSSPNPQEQGDNQQKQKKAESSGEKKTSSASEQSSQSQQKKKDGSSESEQSQGSEQGQKQQQGQATAGVGESQGQGQGKSKEGESSGESKGSRSEDAQKGDKPQDTASSEGGGKDSKPSSKSGGKEGSPQNAQLNKVEDKLQDLKKEMDRQGKGPSPQESSNKAESPGKSEKQNKDQANKESADKKDQKNQGKEGDQKADSKPEGNQGQSQEKPSNESKEYSDKGENQGKNQQESSLSKEKPDQSLKRETEAKENEQGVEGDQVTKGSEKNTKNADRPLRMPKPSEQARNIGPFDGGNAPSLEGSKATDRVEIPRDNEKIDVRGVGKSDNKLYRNPREAKERTGIGSQEFRKPESEKNKDSQPMPVEYKDWLR